MSRRNYAEGMAHCEAITAIPNWDDLLSYPEFRLVLEFPRRGERFASDTAISVLRMARRWATRKARLRGWVGETA